MSTTFPFYYAQETKYLSNNVLLITGPAQDSCQTGQFTYRSSYKCGACYVARTTPKTDTGQSKTFINIQMSRKMVNELSKAYSVFPRAQLEIPFLFDSEIRRARKQVSLPLKNGVTGRRPSAWAVQINVVSLSWFYNDWKQLGFWYTHRWKVHTHRSLCSAVTTYKHYVQF